MNSRSVSGDQSLRNRTGKRHEQENFVCHCFLAVLMRFALSAEAQQPKKMPRIGYLGSVSSPSANSARYRGIPARLRDSVTLRDKTSWSSIATLRED